MPLSNDQQAVISELSSRLGELLLSFNFQVVTAESCTGGWIAQAITETAGSSSWFHSGVVTYSNQAKSHFLNVPEQVLIDYGAVSQQTVEAMAEGAAQLGFGNVSVAISGIAGPGGGTDQKPVGTVWIGWSIDGIISSQHYLFSGDREAIRYQTLIMALTGLIERLEAL